MKPNPDMHTEDAHSEKNREKDRMPMFTQGEYNGMHFIAYEYNVQTMRKVP